MSDFPKNSIEYLIEKTCLSQDKKKYWDIISKSDLFEQSRDWAEFGVASGVSAKIFLKNLPKTSKLYLFDSFEGLPEDWTGHPYIKSKGTMKKGHFKCDVPNFNDERAIIIKGLFQDTVNKWVLEYNKPLGLVHIDCDIYSSAKIIFKSILKVVDDKTLILMDDYYGDDCHRQHMFKAFQEFIENNKIDFQYIAKTTGNHKKKISQVAVKLLLNKTNE